MVTLLWLQMTALDPRSSLSLRDHPDCRAAAGLREPSLELTLPSYSYAMPTKTMEVLRLQDQGSKMFLDSVLTIHERVVQVGTLGET